MLSQLIYQFWQIARLRAGPQDLPSSYLLVVLVGLAYVIAATAMGLFELSFADALFASLVEIAILAGLSFLVLWIRLQQKRWWQTFTALAGVNTILQAMALPLAYWVFGAGVQSPASLVPSILILGLMVWNLIIIAHILRHALDVHLLLGGVFAALYMYISIRVISGLFMVQ